MLFFTKSREHCIYHITLISYNFSISAITCDLPETPENAIREGDNNTEGSQIVFTCREGYSLNGNSHLTCKSQNTQSPLGYWFPDVPECKGMSAWAPFCSAH